MTYQQAIATLNFSQSISREKARKLATSLYGAILPSTSLKTKVAANIVAFGV